MAKNFWDSDKPAGDEWWANDRPAAKQDLPSGVKPSTAGAGRGNIVPPQARQQVDAPASDPSGADDAAAIMAVAPPAPRENASVLDSVQMPAPKYDESELIRMQRREYADAKFAPYENPTPAGPVMKPVPAGPTAKASGDGVLGRAGDLIAAQTYGAASGLGRMAATAAGAVGADSVAENINARASAADEKRRLLQQGVDLEAVARSHDLVPGFSTKSLVQDTKRFADDYLPQILAQSPQAPMAMLGGLTPLVGISYLSSYADARQAGKTPAEAFAYAVPSAAAEYVGEKVGGMGKLNAAFEKAMETGFARDASWRALGRSFAAAGAKEVPSEELTYGLQFINDKFSPVGTQPNATWDDFKKGAADTAIVAMGSGGMLGGAGALMSRASGQGAETGKPVNPDQIKLLKEAGNSEAADLLQRQLDHQSVDQELMRLGPDITGTPNFADRYRELRVGGMKPVDATARATILSDFETNARVAGLSDKAIRAAMDAAGKKNLTELPGFLSRYADHLSQNGVGQRIEGLAQTLDAARDRGLTSGAGLIQAEQPVPEAPVATPEAAQAVDNIAKILAPQIDTGNDIAVTPETDAVHAAATSPLNDLPEPSQAQKEAGNYKVGRLRIAGMDVSIENPQGSVRRGTDASGKPWETPMRHHYGYIRGTTAADGDKLDVFIVPGTPQDYRGPVFVVDQVDPKTGKFDEHKVVLGAKDEADAEAIYRSNYTADWQGLAAITRLPMPAFRAWAHSGTTKEPLGDIQDRAQQTQSAAATPAATDTPAAPNAETSRPDATAVQRVGAPDAGPTTEQPAAIGQDAALQRAEFAAADKARAKKAARLRSGSFDRNPLMAFLGKHGINTELVNEFAPGKTERRKAIVPGYGPIFRKSGLHLDMLAERAAEEGFLPPGHHDERELYNLISRAMRGERIIPQYAEGAVQTQVESDIAARFEDYLDAQSEQDPLDPSGFTEEELQEAGFSDASPEIQAQVRALLDMAEAKGIDAETILENVAKTTENASQQDYYEAAHQALDSALAAGQARSGDRGAPPGPASAATGKAEAKPEVDNQQTPADAGVSVSGSDKSSRPESLIELRKRFSVLKALRKCLESA